VADLKSALVFILQSIVVGLAVAFVIVLVRPDLLPVVVLPADPQPTSFADAVDQSAPSVATVYTKRLVQGSPNESGRSRFRIVTSAASAVIIDPTGLLVTNFHVVFEATEIQVQLSDGRIGEAEIVGVDAETDLALLRVDLGTVPAIRFGSSQQLRVGDIVLAIGNPYGLTKSVTQGIVSATGRGHLYLSTFENFIQTDAAINSGNSGGALINSEGDLIGINTAVLEQDTRTEGIGFAIPVDLVRGVVGEIEKHGRVIRGYIGLNPDDMTTAERLERGLDGSVGILLAEVFEDEPGARAGLRRDDVILSINGEPIRTRRQALLLVASVKPGDKVEIVGWRDGQRFNATVIAGERGEQPLPE
jgi:serine peptidase DegS